MTDEYQVEPEGFNDVEVPKEKKVVDGLLGVLGDLSPEKRDAILNILTEQQEQPQTEVVEPKTVSVAEQLKNADTIAKKTKILEDSGLYYDKRNASKKPRNLKNFDVAHTLQKPPTPITTESYRNKYTYDKESLADVDRLVKMAEQRYNNQKLKGIGKTKSLRDL